MLFLRMIKGNLELWQWILLITVLLPMAIKDYRTKKINVYICLVSILAALVIRLKVMNDNDITLVIDLIPGMITLMLSYLFKDSIGRGDAIMILFMGSVMGIRYELIALSASVMAAGIISLYLMVFKKVDKKTEIPFVPFLSLGAIAGGII